MPRPSMTTTYELDVYDAVRAYQLQRGFKNFNEALDEIIRKALELKPKEG